MERVLGAVPVKLGLRIRMEALVQDLTNALEESARIPSSRRRWGLRRRARSTGNLVLSCHRTQSDDSSSSIGECLISKDRGVSSLHQSDSDDIGLSGGVCRQLAQFSLTSCRMAHLHGNIESDSFNENFSPIHPNTRRFRRRKFKRMAVDMGDGSKPSTSQVPPPPSLVPLGSSKKKRIMKHATTCENRLNNLLCGKRKRSAREINMHCEGVAATRPKTSRIFAVHKMAAGDTHMETAGQCELMSSSSLSSSESDAGLYTNDEGQEGDDEQSDWFGGEGGGRGWWQDDSPPATPMDGCEDEDPTFHAILTGSLEHMSEETKQAYKTHLTWVKEGLSGREIRAGRRRIRGERPGFSILTSANEKLSRFLQDPGQSELRLHPMQRQEREQLIQLANLYSLHMSSDCSRRGLTCPILTKTRNTMQAVRVEQRALGKVHASRIHHSLSEFKRRRRMPPTTAAHPVQAAEVGPIPETNVGNQMLRSMGWEPGTGLGASGNGMQEPVAAVVRPKFQGLGHHGDPKSI